MPTNQEINRALAEWMGYEVIAALEESPYDVAALDRFGMTVMFNPCNDPAASLEVQAAACIFKNDWYIQNLSNIVDADDYWDLGAMGHEGITLMLTASPRDRAMAAYLTIMGAQG